MPGPLARAIAHRLVYDIAQLLGFLNKLTTHWQRTSKRDRRLQNKECSCNSGTDRRDERHSFERRRHRGRVLLKLGARLELTVSWRQHLAGAPMLEHNATALAPRWTGHDRSRCANIRHVRSARTGLASAQHQVRERRARRRALLQLQAYPLCRCEALAGVDGAVPGLIELREPRDACARLCSCIPLPVRYLQHAPQSVYRASRATPQRRGGVKLSRRVNTALPPYAPAKRQAMRGPWPSRW